MENRKGLAILLVLSLVYYFPHCMGSGSSVKSVESVNSTENFLFTYFNLKESGPLLKTLSKDVQYLISGYLRDRYLVPFVLQTPLAEYTTVEADDSGFINSLSFSADDSHLALIKDDDVLIGGLKLNGVSHKGSLGEFKTQVDLRLKSSYMRCLALNDECTRISVTCVNSEQRAQLVEWLVDSNKVAGEEKFIGLLSELFHDETLCRRVSGDPEQGKKNIVVSLCHSHDGALVVATTSNKVYIRSIDGSVRKVEDKRYKVIGDPYFGKALINTSSSTVVFISCDAIVVCDYETEIYRTLQEGDGKCDYVLGISPNGEFLLLVSQNSCKIAYVVQVKTGQSRTIVLPGDTFVGEACFSPDGKWLLIVDGSETLLYDMVTLSLIGCIDHRPGIDERERYSSPNCGLAKGVNFSKTGTYFATHVLVPHSEYKTNPVVAIWQTNPNWHALQNLYKGQITLEQSLFLIFLHKNICERKSLDTIAQEAGFSRQDLVTYLKVVRDSFTVDQKALREFIRVAISRLPL